MSSWSPSSVRSVAVRAIVGSCVALLVAGCAQQRIRDDAQQQLRTGQFEAAVTTLETGLRDHPDSALLRAGLLQARNEASLRLFAEAASARAAGRLDDAEALLKRGLRFDSDGGKRAEALLADIGVERRQRLALAEAERALSAKQPLVAQRHLAEALKDNPRQPELLAMQRKLQAEARRDQVRSAQLGLAETRPISLDFRDAGLRSVLDVITRHSGVNFVLDKDIRQDVRITVLLRAARVQDAIDLIATTHQLAKKVIDSQTVFIYPNTPEKQREHQEQVVKVFYLASAEAKGAAAFLRSMLRVKEPHVDERMNMLAIREPAEVVELAERLMALYDTSEPEVLLELEVLEIRSSRLTDLGIQFPDTIGINPLAPLGGVLTLGNVRSINSDRLGVSVGGLLISLKRTVGDLNTLANPRIRARSRERARILIGDKVPVVTSTTGQGGFVAESVSYLDVGLKLDVEPTVFADDDVAIRVNLEVSSVAREVRTTTGGLAYQIGTRSASTLLRLRDGETQLLAGLISNDERSSANRIPGLGDLPLAGRLFSSQRDESQRTELVLAITPRVLRNIKRPDASESEIWVGTDAMPRARGVGGLAAQIAAGERATAPAIVSTATPERQLEPRMVASPMSVAMRWQAPAEVNVGDSFVVAVEVNSDLVLRGMPLQIQYAPDKLQLLDIEEGEFFRRDGTATSFTKSVDEKTGVVRVGVLRNQATGAMGQGTALRLRLKATAAGAAELGLIKAEPVPASASTPSLVLPPTIRVQIR